MPEATGANPGAHLRREPGITIFKRDLGDSGLVCKPAMADSAPAAASFIESGSQTAKRDLGKMGRPPNPWPPMVGGWHRVLFAIYHLHMPWVIPTTSAASRAAMSARAR